MYQEHRPWDPFNSKKNTSMKDSGKTMNALVKEYNSGETDPSTKDTGAKTSHTDTEDSFMQTETSTSESGSMTGPQAKVIDSIFRNLLFFLWS